MEMVPLHPAIAKNVVALTHLKWNVVGENKNIIINEVRPIQ